MQRARQISAFNGAATLMAICTLTACTDARVDKADAQTEPPAIPASTIEEINRIDQIDFTAYSTDMARHVGLEIGQTKAASNEKIRAYFKPEKGAQGSAEYLFSEFRAEGGNVILATSNGLAGDSIKGEELYAVFKDDTLIIYGLRQKCWRGDMPDIWQTDLCP